MPISLDPSLPSSLYPLAWLVGTWEGSGALHRPGADAGDLRVEQRLECTPTENGTLAWVSEIHTVDQAAPLPPTSVFAREDAPPPRQGGTGERRLLMRERGEWIVGDPLPGQDLQAAREAAPGSPAGFVSYGLTARFEPTSDEDAAPEAAWAGEVRGPRIQLARRDEGTSRVLETRMAGYVSGRLMWLWERRAGDTATGGHVAEESAMIPYLSLELDRA
ncbi:FABP family protein [Brachybacterium sp. p3-SID1565]|uniref:FABP family protein n=1 Tax=Brachybacterium epidermidis TaxID=2781983 RepID=A0ABR9VZG0_9MICO|nr:heme-binding beta-barrel domain-containing protein [Brachybacterium sp. p3-SID1565]MBE9403561.1 FABP family protein [Brachybacterium epidermidis]MCT1386384.1 FABP family protein [Brachybacterium sp. p3-SID1565]